MKVLSALLPLHLVEKPEGRGKGGLQRFAVKGCSGKINCGSLGGRRMWCCAHLALQLLQHPLGARGEAGAGLGSAPPSDVPCFSVNTVSANPSKSRAEHK